MAAGMRILVLTVAATVIVLQPARAEGLRIGGGSSAEAGFSAERLARVDSTIEAAIREQVTPGAALAIGRHGEIVRLRGYGHLSWDRNEAGVNDSTVYDIASLTKVVGTTSAIMVLVERGHLDLDTPIHQYLNAWPSEGDHTRITLRHLLTHTSGLPAGANLWATPGRAEKIERIGRMRLTSAPGMMTTYSDLGMVVAAAIIEAVTGEQLDDFLYREIFEPMGLRDTRFNPRAFLSDAISTAPTPLIALPSPSAFFEQFRLLAAWMPASRSARAQIDAARIAPTEGDVPRGYVHDRNAAAFDGVAGHAGLFSSVRDLAAFSEGILEALHGDDLPMLSAATVREFLEKPEDGQRALGWDVARGDRSSAGDYFSEQSIGHTGFTGTSIWIDPKRDLFVVLLTNRVHPTSANRKHVALRRAVHDAIQLAIDDDIIAVRSDSN